jgi:hypothetical protein
MHIDCAFQNETMGIPTRTGESQPGLRIKKALR